MLNGIIKKQSHENSDEEKNKEKKFMALEIAKTPLVNAQVKQEAYYDKGNKPMQYKKDDIVLVRALNTSDKFHKLPGSYRFKCRDFTDRLKRKNRKSKFKANRTS